MARALPPPRLEDLVREAEVLSTLKASVPHAWNILEHEIDRIRHATTHPATSSASLPTITASPATSTTSQQQQQPQNTPATSATTTSTNSNQHQQSNSQTSVRKRVKLRVPAEQYPDYNFVGRLLGPRGATLKRLERDTACRIMIRGKGSIRKDKEADVRGKPGWEHVFHEPLHVVIEVVDASDDVAAARVLARAKHLVELLLVPVPEERDSLKRAQLRDLAILNGTHRSVADLLTASQPQHLPQPHSPIHHHLHSALAHISTPRASPAASPPPLRRALSATAAHPPKQSPPTHPYDHPFLPSFDPSTVSFTRPYPQQPSRQPASSPPPPSHSQPFPPQPTTPSASFAPASPPSDRYNLPELDKLRIPSLDFDHLSEPNVNLHTLGIPAASPTIVDPDIYPYPPTPGLLNMEHHLQLNAFASPVWTPSRSLSTSAAQTSANNTSAALPPRSPVPVESHNPQHASAFLLGRALGDPARSAHGAFRRSKSAREPGDFSLEQAFAAQSIIDREPGDFSNAQHSYPQREHNASSGQGQSVLASFFPSSPLRPHVPHSQDLHGGGLDFRQQASFASTQDALDEQRQRHHHLHEHEHLLQERHNTEEEQQRLQHESQAHLEQLHREHSQKQLDQLRQEKSEAHTQPMPKNDHHHHH